MPNLYVKKLRITSKPRNKYLQDNNVSGATAQSMSSSTGKGGSWLEQYITYDKENNALVFDISIVSSGGVKAWATSPKGIGSVFDNIPIGSKTIKGVLQVGDGLNVTDKGVISVANIAPDPQTLSFSDNVLTISEGNSVDLSALNIDAYTKAESNKTFALTSHAHPISKITDLQDILDKKAAKAGDGTQAFTVKELNIIDTKTKLTKGNRDSLKITTPYGYLNIAPQNNDYCHFNSDRSFYFNKMIYLGDGKLTSYSTKDLLLQRNGATKLTLGDTLIIAHNRIQTGKDIRFTGVGVGSGLLFNSTVIKNDAAGIRQNGSNNNGYLEFFTTDDDVEPFVFRHYTVGQDGTGSYKDWFRIDNTGVNSYSSIYSSLDICSGSGGALVCRQTTGDKEATGLSLYNTSASASSYGIQFMKTKTKGYNTHGDVTADWAMYFNMSNDAGRGWVFRVNGGENVASISTAGDFSTNGNIIATGEITAYSDRRLKKSVKPLKPRGSLNPVTYVKDGKKSIGFIAQEVHKLYPELVRGNTKDGYLSLNYPQLTAVLYAEKIELKQQMQILDKKVAVLYVEIKELKKQIQILNKKL